ncbi:Gfo/Idh/MocA family protein [Paenibacillus radicis (ex Xue et al. 2023)]|uniref:Gfo/Idh/MocA family oxidoreductase n=1 Tax=Paenibacillus radicis (ex Xue et al. 2023) TaxID=2972489 RepID=A0ABT1YME3_9BACL|nr:Gfo/Idh/MocA family oxidoreductase [Paenibacillus radicis (ex Xue et al. 2023)]MCR8634346.1 Gfo/Idh/MocA family oxidoreductase [Paenibacillus radicis (ex Xue et al. 2023)]
MQRIRIGVIGVGIIGKAHLQEYAGIPGAEVVALCDINEQEARLTAEKYGIPDVYTDFKEMLARDDIDAVDVCLHNNFHAPLTIAALRSGKHVYCEKPIAGSYYDGLTMLEAARESGKKLHIQLGTLYKKETKAAKALIDDGQLGRLFHARSNGFRRRGRPYVDGFGTVHFTKKASAGGGALLDMGVYHIAQMLYLLGVTDVERMTGRLVQEMDMDPQRREDSGFDVEELAVGFVTFKSGVTLDIFEAWAIHLGGIEGSSIVGAKGGIRLPSYHSGEQTGDFSFHTTVADLDLNSTVDLNRMDIRWHRMRSNEDAYDSSQQHWIAALQGRVELLPTADIALATLLISEGLYLADSLGREVTADEIAASSRSLAVKI